MINSKYKFVLLALFCVLVLFIAFFYFYQQPVPPVPDPSPGPDPLPDPDPLPGPGPSPRSEPLTPKEERELQNEAAEIIKTKDFGKCQEIENLLYRTVCINNIALNLAEETQDISYCQRLDDDLVSIANCERKILFEKSLDKEDISVCNETENSEVQEECQENFWPFLALKKENPSLCDSIEDEEEKNICHNNYLLTKDFPGKEEDFDCQIFYGQEAKQDCEIYKEMISNGELLTCGGLKSDLFLSHCMISKLLS